MAAKTTGTKTPAKTKTAPKAPRKTKADAALELWLADPSQDWDSVCEAIGIPKTLTGQRGATLLSLIRRDLVSVRITAKAKK